MNTIKRQTLTVLLALWSVTAWATLSEPDHVFYGTATFFSAPLENNVPITLVLNGDSEPLVTYLYGSDENLGGQYALRVPMGTLDPPLPGTARTGQSASIFIDGELAAEAMIGEPGVAVRLDIDPQILTGQPNFAITDVEQFEGNAGSLFMTFVVSISDTTDSDARVLWETMEGTATGGTSCSAGVDFVTSTGQASIAPGNLSTVINVPICGDTDQGEGNETLIVQLSNPGGANLLDDQALGTILDDDELPTLSVADVLVSEPGAGSTVVLITVSLSQSSESPVTLSYRTQNATALAGTDYLPVSGSAEIAAGQLEQTVAVTVLADNLSEANETFWLMLSNAVGAVIADDAALVTIIDPLFEPTVEQASQTVQGVDGVTGLLGPSAITESPDGRFVYVSGRSLDTVVTFSRAAPSSQLTFVSMIDNSVTGFADAALDGANDIVMSPDGLHVYVAALRENGVSAFARNAGTGELTHVASFRSTDPVAGLEGASSMAFSPDGAQLYVTGRQAGTVVVFNRDAASGALTFVEAETNGADDPTDPGGAVSGLAQASAVVVSPDGAQVYATGAFDNAVAVFNRVTDSGSADFGRLSFVEVHANESGGVIDLQSPSDLLVTPDGEHVYVTAEASNAVVLFDRAANGTLSFRGAIKSGDENVAGLLGAKALAIREDGSLLFAAGFADDTVTVFGRDTNAAAPEFGELRALQTLRDAEGAITNMGWPEAVMISHDGAYVFVVSNRDNAVVVLGTLVLFADGFED